MKTLRALIADRWLQLFLLSAVAAVVLGFFTLSDELAMRVVIYGGYWVMLGLVVLFARSLWRLGPPDPAAWVAAPRWPIALILGCGTLLLVHEAYGFKILMDEAMLLGTSMSMHFDKMALVPMRGHDIQGAFQIMGGELDKRPLLHPFLLSVLHDLTGYRPENAFVLNTGLTFVLLTLAYDAGRRIAGRAAGALTVLLLTSLPLLAQNATGGGFEILNLVMILASLLLGMRALEQRDGRSLEALLLAGILLASTRYESVLFLLPVGLVILRVWWVEQRPVLTPVLVLGPLLLVPYALHNRVFSARTTAWELASKPGFERPFDPAYLPDNLAHALNFFFDASGEQSNSLVIAVLGFLAAPFFALWVYKTLRSLRTAVPARAALAVFSLGFAAHTLLLLCYFWGKFDDPVIRRLSLPLNLGLVLAVVGAAAGFGAGPRIWRGLALLTGVGTFVFSIPVMARHDYSLDYYVGREMEWRRDFIAAHPLKDYLFIDNNSIMWITHLVSATPFTQALHRKDVILFNQRNRVFSAIYVFQRLRVDPVSGGLSLEPDEDLGPDYQLEPVIEQRFTPFTVSRISRVVAIADGPASPPVVAGPGPVLTAEEREKVRQQYLEEFIKQLP
ncbi:hypothetical protein Verru16b_01600 [Lacunisphaera limnophila]|uniref:Glycosyltransferase RgtA/B/C/D-like domain-containing protein n=1 Tax=Lacunisphaera limnophila TaxID=1838286 RepID=A0A1D8AUH7_9BACT|nr:glycosyltransferase family 39 protein [Lacunisphaera limnophila]AOS44537.1 hypothetical protein Verru16b_01600 [Lacunisphaera limnophila]